ncbi:hypothetical protein LTR93_012257, partial [Exophiala xenobiotica]
AHAERIGHHWNLYDKALFQTEVRTLQWDEQALLWTSTTNWGDKFRSRFVVPAAGPLHRPKLPGTKGIEKFKRHSFHSSRWDYNYTGGDNFGILHKLSDKRVGIIGTGATAIQIVPHLGEWAEDLYVFQRTPSSVDVRGNRPTDPDFSNSLRPGWQKERMDNCNTIVSGRIDILHKLLARTKKPGKDKAVDPEKAAADGQKADFKKMEQIRARCNEVVNGPKTADALKPWYNQLCERPCLHDGYLQTFNRPSVHLVDTDGKGIEEITENGVIASGKPIELDVLVFATGFELATSWSHRTNIEITGRGGEKISKHWADGTRTLHSWTTRSFPNCFFIQVFQAVSAPNFLHITGEQARHIAYVISECRKRGVKAVEPTVEAENWWVDTILEKAKLRAEFLA